MLLRGWRSRHEAAKKVLIDEGRPKELVDAMPHVQVAIAGGAGGNTIAVFDECLKCQSLPFCEAKPALAKAAKRQKETGRTARTSRRSPSPGLFLPAVQKVFAAHAPHRPADRRPALRRGGAPTPPPTTASSRRPSTTLKDVPFPRRPRHGQAVRLPRAPATGPSCPVHALPQPAVNNVNTPTYELMFHPMTLQPCRRRDR